MEVVRRMIIKGRVQLRGFRQLVKMIAWDYNIVGTVENLEDGSVEVICKAEKKNYEEFKKVLKKLKGDEEDYTQIIVRDIDEYSKGVSVPKNRKGFIVIRKQDEHEDTTEAGLFFLGQVRGSMRELMVKYGKISKDMGLMQKDIHSIKDDMHSMKDDMHSIKDDMHSMKGDVHKFSENSDDMKDDLRTVADYIKKNLK